MKPKRRSRVLDGRLGKILSISEPLLWRTLLHILTASPSPSIRYRLLSIGLLSFLLGALVTLLVFSASTKVLVDNLWVLITVAIILAFVALVLYLLKRHTYAPAEQTAEYPGRPLFTSEDVEGRQGQTAAHPVTLGRGYESISFTIELPNKLLIRDFAEVIGKVTSALEKAGYILYLINSGEIPERFFLRTARYFVFELDERKNRGAAPLSIPDEAQLAVVRMHYGSPVAFDLAGMGKIGKELRELIKDIFYRISAEKKKATIENQAFAKQAEIDLMKETIRVEAMTVELIKSKIRLINDIQKLKLPDEKKEVLIEALARELSVLPLAGIGRDSLPEPKMSEDE
jgi:hypothetical protein